MALFLAEAAERFPDVRVLDLGGGLGVPERPGRAALDLDAPRRALRRVQGAPTRASSSGSSPGASWWPQPGVLLARVTQVKRKGERASTSAWRPGMNSLIRPALYGAYHPIVNLSRLDEPAA